MNRETMSKLAQQHISPCYVFDLDVLDARIEKIRETLGGRAKICYAMKANPFLVEFLKDRVDGFEVCSPGEFRICERSGIPMKSIVLSGVNKEKREIQRVLELYEGRGIYTIESESQLHMLQECAAEVEMTLRVLLRISSGNQFGVDWDTAETIIREREKYTNLIFEGIQQYTGTQKKKKEKIKKELELLDCFLVRMNEQYQYEAETLEYGPGLYVPYFLGEKEEIQEKEQLDELCRQLDALQFGGQVVLELGRYIAADCGYFFTKVVDCKENYGEHYAIVDGGIHHINYYGQFMAMKIPEFVHIHHAELDGVRIGAGSAGNADCDENSGKKESENTGNNIEMDSEKNWNICGSLCTSGDIIAKKMPLINLQLHDILVFGNVGAYSVTEAMYLFLSRDLPKVYSYSEKNDLETNDLETNDLEKKQLKLLRDAYETNLWNSIRR